MNPILSGLIILFMYFNRYLNDDVLSTNNFYKMISEVFSNFSIIDTPQGRIKGYIEYDTYGNKYWAYKGIPYGIPPIGKLRFEPPVKFEKWNGVKDTFSAPSICVQNAKSFIGDSDIVFGNEDCLYLSVYSKSVTLMNQPVMVFIHGGGYELGNGGFPLYNPGWLVQKGVILVTINYRLNAFGFFSIEDKSFKIFGNQGLKDQLLALKWVRDNIKSYGGNPNQVTVFGQSAGAASIGYHLVSEKSRGLFHRVIMQSASPENYWCSQKGYTLQEIKKAFSRIKDDWSTLKIKKYLQNLDKVVFLKLMNKVREIRRNDDNLVNWFTPNIELDNPDGFLKDYTSKLMKNGYFNDVPIMIGFNKDEGGIALLFNTFLPTLFKSNYTYFVPPFLNVSEENKDLIGKKIVDFFFKNKSLDDVESQIKYASSVFFDYEFIKYAKKLPTKKTTPTYMYELDVYTGLNIFQYFLKFHPNTFATDFTNYTIHCDEFGYLFPQPFISPILRVGDAKDISEGLINLWTNFAKTSNPNNPIKSKLLQEKWLPLKKAEFLRITNKFAKMDSEPKKETNDFWDSLKNS